MCTSSCTKNGSGHCAPCKVQKDWKTAVKFLQLQSGQWV